MGKLLSFIVGILFGALGGAIGLVYWRSQKVAAEEQIVFDKKSFYDASPGQEGYVAISGTMTGEPEQHVQHRMLVRCQILLCLRG
jgi:hypothetical protein